MATYHEHSVKGRQFRILVSGIVGGSATGGFEAQPFEIRGGTESEFGPPLAAGTAEQALERAKKAIDDRV